MDTLRSVPPIQYLCIPQLNVQQEYWLEFFAPYYVRISTLKCPSFPSPKEAKKAIAAESSGLSTVLLPKRALWREYFELAHDASDALILERLLVTFGQGNRKTPLVSYLDEVRTRYRLKAQTATSLAGLEAKDTSSFCLIRMDNGEFHRGKSPAGTLRTLREQEFGLDVLSGLALIMTCRQEFSPTDLFHLSCPGSEYDPQGKNTWADTPRWDIEFGSINLEWNWDTRARRSHLNLTAFAP